MQQRPSAQSTAGRAPANLKVGPRPNSLNLQTQALGVLLDRLDTHSKDAHAKNPTSALRDFVRWPFRRESLEVRVLHPGGSFVVIRVACRNLSRGGLSVLHNSFVHAGTECRVMLPHPARGLVEVPATVVRCMHRSGVIHELGVAFRNPVNAREFLQADPFSNSFSLEQVSPTDLRGKLLVIEPSATDRSILKHFLRQTSLEVVIVTSLAEAVLACEGVDAILASSELSDTDPSTLVSTIRECRFDGPIVLLVPDASPSTRARTCGLTVQAIAVQPVTQDLLLRALSEVLLVDQPAGAASQENPSQEWIKEQLATIERDLYQFTCSRNIKYISKTCQRLRELSESMGWTVITTLTTNVLTPLSKGKPLDSVRPTIDMLLSVCESGEDPAKAA
jgi:CheY-like chemotaxis protein